MRGHLNQKLDSGRGLLVTFPYFWNEILFRVSHISQPVHLWQGEVQALAFLALFLRVLWKALLTAVTPYPAPVALLEHFCMVKLGTTLVGETLPPHWKAMVHMEGWLWLFCCFCTVSGCERHSSQFFPQSSQGWPRRWQIYRTIWCSSRRSGDGSSRKRGWKSAGLLERHWRRQDISGLL